MDARERARFVDAYTRILTLVWSRPDGADQLAADPRGVLAGGGLDVPADAELVIVRRATGEPDLQAQIDLWDSGRRTGRYVLHLPALPVIPSRELSENALGDLSGGGPGACCSCCPCSCST